MRLLQGIRARFVVGVLLLAVACPAIAQQRSSKGKPHRAPKIVRADGLSPDLTALLAEIKRKDTGQLAVSEEDGRFLRLMIASRGAKRLSGSLGCFGGVDGSVRA